MSINIHNIKNMDNVSQWSFLNNVYDNLQIIITEILRLPNEFSLEQILEELGQNIEKDMCNFCIEILVNTNCIWLVSYNLNDELQNVYKREEKRDFFIRNKIEFDLYFHKKLNR